MYNNSEMWCWKLSLINMTEVSGFHPSNFVPYIPHRLTIPRVNLSLLCPRDLPTIHALAVAAFSLFLFYETVKYITTTLLLAVYLFVLSLIRPDFEPAFVIVVT